MKIAKTKLVQIIREELQACINESAQLEPADDYEEAMALQLKRANRDGLRGEEAYNWAKKNLRALGIHPPKAAPALGQGTNEGEIADLKWASNPASLAYQQ